MVQLRGFVIEEEEEEEEEDKFGCGFKASERSPSSVAFSAEATLFVVVIVIIVVVVVFISAAVVVVIVVVVMIFNSLLSDMKLCRHNRKTATKTRWLFRFRVHLFL